MKDDQTRRRYRLRRLPAPRKLLVPLVGTLVAMQERWHGTEAGSQGSHPAHYDGGGPEIYEGRAPPMGGSAHTATGDLLSEVPNY